MGGSISNRYFGGKNSSHIEVIFPSPIHSEMPPLTKPHHYVPHVGNVFAEENRPFAHEIIRVTRSAGIHPGFKESRVRDAIEEAHLANLAEPTATPATLYLETYLSIPH